MKENRTQLVSKWSSVLLSIIFIWTFSFHDWHYISDGEHHDCETCNTLTDASDVSIQCGGQCSDPDHHHHDHSSTEHSDNCIVCQGNGVDHCSLAQISLLLVCTPPPSPARSSHPQSSTHLFDASPRGPPVLNGSII